MIKFVTLLCVSISINAAEPHPNTDPANYCHDREGWESIDRLLRNAPDDTVVIRMYALRKGLCTLIEEKKIKLDAAVDIFELERSRAIIERQNEELSRQSDIQT